MSSINIKTAKETTKEATSLIRAEKARLAEIQTASEKLTEIADLLEKIEQHVEKAGEILIGNEISAIEVRLGQIAGKLWDARKRKTHAELDEMMREETVGRRYAD